MYGVCVRAVPGHVIRTSCLPAGLRVATSLITGAQEGERALSADGTRGRGERGISQKGNFGTRFLFTWPEPAGQVETHNIAKVPKLFGPNSLTLKRPEHCYLLLPRNSMDQCHTSHILMCV